MPQVLLPKVSLSTSSFGPSSRLHHFDSLPAAIPFKDIAIYIETVKMGFEVLNAVPHEPVYPVPG